jgi:hypothetical protein
VRAGLRAVVALLLVLAVPGIACLCYYASVDISPQRAGWSTAVRLAWPAMLVAGVGLVGALVAQRRRGWIVRISTTVLMMSGALLLIADQHWFGF